MDIRILSTIAIATGLTLGCKSESKAPPPPPTKGAVSKPAEKKPEEKKPEEKKPEEPPAAAAGGTGTIKGVVSFKGDAPKPEKVDMKKDPTCVKQNKGGVQPSTKVADGKLAEVLVHPIAGLPDKKWDVREDMIEMDQVGCVYTPRMIGIQVKQKLKVKNSDPTLHNVHAHAKRSEFNQAMPIQGSTLEKKFKAKDLEAKITCDAHPWMEAQLRVLDHPFFALSGADGSFIIEKVPAGKYTLEFEHRKLGKKTAEVEVKADGTAEANIEFGG